MTKPMTMLSTRLRALVKIVFNLMDSSRHHLKPNPSERYIFGAQSLSNLAISPPSASMLLMTKALLEEEGEQRANEGANTE
jgi:hypothetical protein